MDHGQAHARADERRASPVSATPAPTQERDSWLARLQSELAAMSPAALGIAEAAVRACPRDGHLLLSAVLAALIAGKPDRASGLLKHYEHRFNPSQAAVLLTGLTLAAQGHSELAWTTLQAAGQMEVRRALWSFVGGYGMEPWLEARITGIRTAHRLNMQAARAAERKAAKPAPRKPTVAETTTPIEDLARPHVALEQHFELLSPERIQLTGEAADPVWFALRAELAQLGLIEGFDELLCLPTLRGVDAHWYQIETVRKVLKQYRGRVLLADEVGLGKTVEAGMVLKEYLLRGMAERILILVPAPLVGQWAEEMGEKFGIDCATTHAPLLRQAPEEFWAQKRIIASTAVARRKEHAALLAANSYDVVVVDEAHHLRDQASALHRLVSSLQKRFLLLLSATPVQNSLIELYNLLTLLQPGIFRTQKEFRAAYMTPGKPREPANRDRLRDLMRGVMIRNTRALASLRLPHRQAATVRAVPGAEEAGCYAALSDLAAAAALGGQARLAVQHLLSAAGSSPAAAAAAVARFAERHAAEPAWLDLAARYRAVGAGAKQAALLKLLAQNPAEKKMIFIHHRDSMADLAELLRRQGMDPLLFDGSMSGPDKDRAVAAFRDSGRLLLCSESGGEGRNLQFCNTLINFDIPWNPMAIEQRIGRIDRIGQTREVFVFNLVTSGTIEDAMLRILDEKINMFELVVGEVGAILGEIDDQQEFSSIVLDAWLHGTDAERQAAFAVLEERVVAAQRQYEDTRQLDDALFGDDLDAA